ncbi:hypothetical protein FACS1894167_09350 [Synergistales bacterium]|nr:hypothetical protein FACS1894167_09350 [Synergistales bacterium]
MSVKIAKLFDKDLDIRAQAFNLLGCAGIFAGIAVAGSGLLTGAGVTNFAGNLAASAIGAALLYLADRTGRYHLLSCVTIAAVFIVLFPVLFFTAGGYHSGMPSFFIFAVIFTVLLLDRAELFAAVALEILLYTGICLYAYFHPESVSFFETEPGFLGDVMTGWIASVSVLSAAIFLYFRIYNRQQSELDRKSKAKTAFLANMSHEIRTPVNVMLGMNEIIGQETESDAIAGYSARIKDAGEALMKLVDDILDVSKIEAGKQEVVEADYSAPRIVRELSARGAEWTGKKGLAFTAEADPEIPRLLFGDAPRIKQIAANFLSNAAKYTASGGVTLKIGMERNSPPDDGKITLIVSVSDTGAGITSGDTALLFDKFTRLDLKTHRDVEGAGLGLAIAKNLTELMGGKISAESVPGKGSTFTASIPQTVHDAAPMGDWRNHRESGASGEPAAAGSGFAAPGARALVVDDNEGNRQVISAFLERMMIKVDAAESAEGCMASVKSAALKNEPYHVIILDYLMPVTDGIETLRRLKNEDAGFGTPVIALTADAIKGTREKLLGAGFALYLSKPIVTKELEDALASCLPEELTLKSSPAPGSARGLKEESELMEDDLAPYGVSLKRGLRLLKGDVRLFLKLARIFRDDEISQRTRVSALSDARDWDALSHVFHSLKAKAKGMGALDLRDTAAKLERACRAGDGEYAMSSLPLALLEWRRACDGLSLLIRKTEGIIPPPEPVYAGEGPPSADALLSHIGRHNLNKSAREADRLIAEARAEGDAEKEALLKEIGKAAREVKFGRAKALLSAYMEDERE